MTDSPVLPGLEASGWAGDYLARASGGDLFAGAPAEMAPRWRAMLDRLSEQGQGDPATLAGNVERGGGHQSRHDDPGVEHEQDHQDAADHADECNKELLRRQPQKGGQQPYLQ